MSSSSSRRRRTKVIKISLVNSVIAYPQQWIVWSGTTKITVVIPPCGTVNANLTVPGKVKFTSFILI